MFRPSTIFLFFLAQPFPVFASDFLSCRREVVQKLGSKSAFDLAEALKQCGEKIIDLNLLRDCKKMLLKSLLAVRLPLTMRWVTAVSSRRR